MNTKAALIWTGIGLTAASGWAGPYPGPAGTSNSTAIAANDPGFVAWANSWTNYQPGAELDPAWTNASKALGPAEGDITNIVSLGRGGSITVSFPLPITDKPGWDFAVFENAFNDTFLELAYVEVSSDGIHFFRLASASLTPEPVPPYGSVDPTDVDGLAGKYRAGYGTPFDLAELRGVSAHLDLTQVRYIRLLDIVGDGTATDSSGRAIYDPYPTTGSAGFDLDAVGILHSSQAIQLDPNPQGMQIRWFAARGRTYQLQACNNLSAGEWEDVGAPIAGDDAFHQLIDTGRLSRMCFYRVLCQ